MLASGGEQLTVARHRPPEQQPSLQELLSQQTSPRPPHLAQTPPPQVEPAWHAGLFAPAGQQVSPTLPHAAHVPALHKSPS
jgi:hypothetical protein